MPNFGGAVNPLDRRGPTVIQLLLTMKNNVDQAVADTSKKRSDGIPFMRRTDLIDPTSRLNQWQVRFPKA
jgi:hypothetical protein